MWLKYLKALVTRYVLLCYQSFSYLDYQIVEILSNMTRSRGHSGQTIEIHPVLIPFKWKYRHQRLLDHLFLLEVPIVFFSLT